MVNSLHWRGAGQINVLIILPPIENIVADMKNRNAFSALEILLVAVILGLLAAVFVPATAVIAEKSRAEVVKAHISQIIEAGKKYNADKGTESVDYNTLVSEKYLKPVQSVAGEKYDEISIEAAGGSAKTVTARGTEVSRAY